MAAAVDLLAVHAWQNGEGKPKDYPKPIPRPGVTPDDKTFGSNPIPVDEMQDWLGDAFAEL